MDKKKRITFIVNPISGTHGKDEIPHLIDELLDYDLYEHEVRMTEYAVTGKLVDGSNSEVGNAKATMTATGAGTVTITGCTDTQEPCKTAKSSLPSGGKIAGFSVTFSAS